MREGRALHIAATELNRDHYRGAFVDLGEIAANGAEAIRQIARQRGFTMLNPLEGTDASAANVLKALGAQSDLRAGDTLLVSFSGHGYQVPTQDRLEPDEKSETWVLNDRMLLDAELRNTWKLFEPGVRIIAVVDSCNARSSTFVPASFVTTDSRFQDAMLVVPPLGRGRRTFLDVHWQEHAAEYAAIRERTDRVVGRIAVSGLEISAAASAEFSFLETSRSRFISAVESAWKARQGIFPNGYRQFVDEVQEQLDQRFACVQHPDMTPFGVTDERLLAEQPFSF